MNIGKKIIEIRKERNMTQEDFANIFHVTRQTVSNWGKRKKLSRFANAYSNQQ